MDQKACAAIVVLCALAFGATASAQDNASSTWLAQTQLYAKRWVAGSNVREEVALDVRGQFLAPTLQFDWLGAILDLRVRQNLADQPSEETRHRGLQLADNGDLILTDLALRLGNTKGFHGRVGRQRAEFGPDFDGALLTTGRWLEHVRILGFAGFVTESVRNKALPTSTDAPIYGVEGRMNAGGLDVWLRFIHEDRLQWQPGATLSLHPKLHFWTRIQGADDTLDTATLGVHHNQELTVGQFSPMHHVSRLYLEARDTPCTSFEEAENALPRSLTLAFETSLTKATTQPFTPIIGHKVAITTTETEPRVLSDAWIGFNIPVVARLGAETTTTSETSHLRPYTSIDLLTSIGRFRARAALNTSPLSITQRHHTDMASHLEVGWFHQTHGLDDNLVSLGLGYRLSDSTVTPNEIAQTLTISLSIRGAR